MTQLEATFFQQIFQEIVHRRYLMLVNHYELNIGIVKISYIIFISEAIVQRNTTIE